jgi:hypothetical protein
MRRPLLTTTPYVKPEQHGMGFNSHPVYDNFLLSEIFYRLWGPHTFFFIGYWSVILWVQNDQCVKYPDLEIVPGVGTSRSVTPIVLYAFMACIRDNFILCELRRNSDLVGAQRSGDQNCSGGEIFPHPSRPAVGITQPPVQCIPGLFAVGKAAGTWR